MPLGKGFEYRFGEHEFRSVRESIAVPMRFVPIEKTLASANAAEDLLAIDQTSLLPAMNLVTNPSIETAGTPPAGFTAVGATVTRVTTTPRTGTYSMSVVTANVADNTGEGAYFEVSDIPPGNYALSAYLRHSGGGTARIKGSSDGGATFTNGNVVTMANNWNGRSTIIHKVFAGQDSIRVYIVTSARQNITFLVDDVQVEPSWAVIMGYGSTREVYPPSASVTDFVDPLGDRFSRWLGTANASNSVREPRMGEIHYLSVYTSHDTYLDFDRTVSDKDTDPKGYKLVAGIDYRLDLHKVIKKNVSFVNATGSETPLVIGYAMGF